jgi:hypothetical protein
MLATVRAPISSLFGPCSITRFEAHESEKSVKLFFASKFGEEWMCFESRHSRTLRPRRSFWPSK